MSGEQNYPDSGRINKQVTVQKDKFLTGNNTCSNWNDMTHAAHRAVRQTRFDSCLSPTKDPHEATETGSK